MRKLDSDHKPEPLSEPAKLEIWDRHLPYRIDLLKDAIDRIPAKSMADNQAFEAGAVAGRSILSFLGIRYDRRVRKLAPDQKYSSEKDNLTDEVKVTDLGGKFVEIDELSEDQKVVLSRFIHGVHKACAHFTWNSQHSLTAENYKTAAALILELYKRQLKRCLLHAKI